MTRSSLTPPPKVPDTASADGSETDVLCTFSPVEALASDLNLQDDIGLV